MVKMLIKKTTIKNIDYILFTLLYVITVIVLLRPSVYSNGVGYYSWLRSATFDKNLDTTNEFKHYTQLFQEKYGWSGVTDDLKLARTKTGYQSDKYTIGPAIFWAPFFAIGHGMTLLLNKFGAHYPVDGYSYWYVLMISIGSSLYGFLGLLLGYKFSKKFFSESASSLALLGVWFASSAVFYMYFHPSLSHAIEIFTVASFIYFWWKIRETGSLVQWGILGVLGGLMMLVRTESVVYLIIPGLDFFTQFWHNKEKRKSIMYSILLFGVFLILTFSPQVIVWKIVYGKFFLNAYGAHFALIHPIQSQTMADAGVGDTSLLKYFSHPHLFQTFSGKDYGLFTWTPLILFAIVGLFLAIRKYTLLSSMFLLVLFGIAYVVSCAGGGGGSFGARYLVRNSFIFIFGLAAFFEAIHSKISFRWITIIILFFVWWNFSLIIQYVAGKIGRGNPFEWSQIIKNQVLYVPKTVMHKGKMLLFQKGRRFNVSPEKNK